MADVSSGKVNAALTTGIIGTSGFGLNLLGNLLGNMVMPANAGCGCAQNQCGCSEDHYVNRYEAGQAARIAELETEVKLRDANFYALSEVGKLRDYMETRFTHVEHELCDQKIYNATNTAAIGCINSQIAALMSLTKLVVPNASVCPGWGHVTVTPATTTTTG
jgi:hypothetical protein